jgi:hypothetical protein
MANDPIMAIPQGAGGPDAAVLVTALNDRIRRINIALAQAAVPAAAATTQASLTMTGTHAQRIARPVATKGTLYVETDRGSIVYLSNGKVWQYLNGTWAAGFTSLPADLGVNDYGFLFQDTTHWRIFQWAATGGAPAVTSPGWRRAPGELPTATIAVLPYGGGQMAVGWALCTGTLGVSITQDDASAVATNVPNIIGAFPKGGTVGTYSVTPVAASVPTISGHTELASAVLPTVASAAGIAAIAGTTGVDNTAGQIVQSGTGITVASHTHGHSAGTIADAGHQHNVSAVDTGHQHNLTSLNAPIALPGDPIVAVTVPWYIKR